MKIVKGTLWSIDTIDLGEMFRQRSVRLEHGRVNEILFYEVYSEYPTSYTKMLTSEDYFLHRYVSVTEQVEKDNVDTNFLLPPRPD